MAELDCPVDLPVLAFRGVAMLPGSPAEVDEFSAAEARGGGWTVSAPFVGTNIGSAKLGAMPSLTTSVDKSPEVDADLLR